MAFHVDVTDDEIKGLIADYNGDEEFKTDEAQFGYIDPKEYLILPNTRGGSDDFAQAIPVTTEEERKLAARFEVDVTCLNVPALGGNVDSIKYAYLRAKLVAKGVLKAFGGGIKGARKVYTNETRVANAEDVGKVTADIIASVKTFIASPERKFIDKHWRILVSICAHVLAVRSHHYKEGVAAEQSYDNLYERLWKACAIDDRFPFTDLKKLYRTALHPFGLLAFSEIYADGIQNNRIPRTLMIRFDAMPAGAAKPGTALAIVNLMRAAAWFPWFRDAFVEEITRLEAAVELIKEDRYAYHVAHNLYGKPVPKPDDQKVLDEAIASAHALAPYLVGYVNVECTNSPIQAQMTLRGAALDQQGLMNRFMRFLTGVGAKAEREQDIKALLPAPQADVPAPPPVPNVP